jgi:hypothetical protein
VHRAHARCGVCARCPCKRKRNTAGHSDQLRQAARAVMSVSYDDVHQLNRCLQTGPNRRCCASQRYVHSRTTQLARVQASARRKRSRASTAAPTSSGDTNSAGEWLTPPRHRTNSMLTGHRSAIAKPSWPAPLTSSGAGSPAECGALTSATTACSLLNSAGEHSSAAASCCARACERHSQCRRCSASTGGWVVLHLTLDSTAQAALAAQGCNCG